MEKYLYYKEKDYTLYKGKMQDVLSSMPDNSVDAIITDPPYEISFMGKGWDATGVAYTKETWEHCFRVLKPGGYLLSFGATRTFHRIACAIEDAGFEIRDTIMWLYGSGFPKSMNIGLAIDKKNGVDNRTGNIVKGVGSNNTNSMKNGLSASQEFDSEYEERKAQNEWSGWGTCLKPAYEPIIVARKPFKGSLVDNVIKYGVGGINIDECRIKTEEVLVRGGTLKKMTGDERNGKSLGMFQEGTENKFVQNENGRFPANVILTYDETDFDEVCGGFPNTKGGGKIKEKGNFGFCFDNGKRDNKPMADGYDDSGSASRYFYCAKASKKDRDEGLDLFESKQLYYDDRRGNSFDIFVKRNENGKPLNDLRKNIHPTVKPVELMQYLVRLVTPKGGIIMDCFMGSGSTGKAVMFENRERNANYHFIGVEMTEEYLPICQSRIDYALNKYEYDLAKEIQKEKEENEKKGYVSLFDF